MPPVRVDPAAAKLDATAAPGPRDVPGIWIADCRAFAPLQDAEAREDSRERLEAADSNLVSEASLWARPDERARLASRWPMQEHPQDASKGGVVPPGEASPLPGFAAAPQVLEPVREGLPEDAQQV